MQRLFPGCLEHSVHSFSFLFLKLLREQEDKDQRLCFTGIKTDVHERQWFVCCQTTIWQQKQMLWGSKMSHKTHHKEMKNNMLRSKGIKSEREQRKKGMVTSAWLPTILSSVFLHHGFRVQRSHCHSEHKFHSTGKGKCW